ncbi:PVC-type heme-binding CxxCH protein [Verrucomicrobiales bacterium BCK34]|nr:PVC-type heme-binding CxxCH protein [Verrucomicrobiales bacterium BCK34]
MKRCFSLRRWPHLVVALSVLSVGLSLRAADHPSAQFVRISIPGEGRILTLAEVEVISGGKNVAPEGKASQSSESAGGKAERGIDGNKDGDYNKGGQTHTSQGKDAKDPWWEVDLGSVKEIEKIQIWNRNSLQERLDGFTLELLDANRKPVLSREGNAAPIGSVSYQFGGEETEVAYFGQDGKALPVPVRPEKVPDGYRDPEPFAFKKEDQIAIIGNGLADRMQHDGWMETFLQAANPDAELAFRNMSLTGDRIDRYPRSKGFMEMNDYLRHVQADVIFAFFGYNESFAGAKGLEEFEKKLTAMIATYRGIKANGESFARIVLFSPIAHENLNDPNLPDGKANNRRLALYSAAMQKVAQHEGVAFVDLFNPTKELYAAQSEPMTLNGIHLNERGNYHLGQIIAKALSGKVVEDEALLSSVRDAVLEKNWHWHNRYRAVDGNDVWGGRSTLRFVNDQSNADVLMHELTMLDVMTANRDPLIWSKANGSDWKVDDSNVPGPVEVISNVGGGSKSSSSEKEGSLEYLSGEEGIKKMTVPEGFKVNLFADEAMFPEMVNPVQMQVDGKGRLWAAAWATYPKWEPLKEMNDALLILPDDDGDGVADRCVEFAKVHNPLGFEFWNGGVIVTSQPDILFLKDTDGDDVADVRYVLFQGTGSSDTHHAANNLIYGPDGGIYWQSGVFLQHNHEHPWGPSLEANASAMYRFDPRRYTISFHAGNSPNPHGTSFDDWGYMYANDGTGGRSYQVRPDGEGFKMFPLVTKEVRPVAADQIIGSTNFPDEMQGNFLVCNTIGFLGLKQYQLHRDGYEVKTVQRGKKGEPDTEVTVTYQQGEVWGTPTDEMLSSADKNFRPTDAVFGEDGALYVSDWHNVIIGHMQHNIRDPNRDKKHGRIYRIVNTKKPLQEAVEIDGASVAALLDNFKHPVSHVRHRTRVELSERSVDEVVPAAKKWAATLDPKKKEDGIPLLEALWVHQQFNVRDRDLLNVVLSSVDPHVANGARTVRHHWDVADPTKNVVTSPIEQEEEKIDIDIPEHFSKAEAAAYKLGAEVFHRDAHCVTCHQGTGDGIVNIYPPLKESKWVTGNEDRLIKLTLNGLWGAIEVNGVTYDPTKGVPPMTAFKALLDDNELAAVLTYVRNTWGNKASPISPEKVKEIREATKSQQIFYKPEELLKEHPFE